MQGLTTEKLILNNLIKNQKFASQTIHHISELFFHDRLERELFLLIKQHINSYNSVPCKSILVIDTKNNSKLNELESDSTLTLIDEIFTLDDISDYDWLIKETEAWCQNKAVYNGVMSAIGIYDGTDKKTSPTALPELFREAVSISFDNNVGMDYFDDAESRFDYYTSTESKLKFSIEMFNRITNGGLPRRTLSVLAAGINCSKTLGLCSLAADYLKDGLNVLFVSLETRTELIGQRIDANLLDININDIDKMSRDDFTSKINKIKSNSLGKLKIKEYAPNSISCLHIRNLLAELDLKQKFKPDVIMVDYIGILLSSRVTNGNNTYLILKAAAEELRGIGVDYDAIIWSATQITRGSQTEMDATLADVADSIGISATCDMMLLLTRSEELDQIGEIHCKQLKNRFGSKVSNLRFNLSIDLDKQRISDVANLQTKTEMKLSTELKTNTADKLKRFNNLTI